MPTRGRLLASIAGACLLGGCGAGAGDFLALTASNGKQDAGPFVDLVRITLDYAA